MKPLNPNIMIMDAGYKTPAIAKMLIDDGIKPLFPYKSPMTKKGFFRKYQYVYDEYYDCYLCPNDKILKYRTTNRDGYREYKSNPHDCAKCPYIDQCTESQNHQKTVTRHIWEDYVEITEDIRHTIGMKDLYNKRKETIERLFGTAKENHGFRYTQMYGKARMQMKVGLTFACMNLKKLARILKKKGIIPTIFRYFPKIYQLHAKTGKITRKLDSAELSAKPSLSTVWGQSYRGLPFFYLHISLKYDIIPISAYATEGNFPPIAFGRSEKQADSIVSAEK